MRVVADTNTVVSAFLWGGPPKAVLDAARDGRISLHTLGTFDNILILLAAQALEHISAAP